MNRRAFLLAGGALAGLSALRGQAETPPRIVVFGDSLAEGYGLPPHQGLVPQLQGWLDERGVPARLVNAGLSGDSSFGGRVRIRWALRGGADGVVIELGGNDFLAGFGLRDTERNLDSIIVQAKRGGRPVLLVGVVPPAQYMAHDPADVARMWQRLAERHGVLLHPDLFAPLWRAPQSQWGSFLQDDGIHLSASGVSLAVGDLGPMLARLAAQAAD
ncbi:GDSL-type esterase/lipase family protein [uncultured Paracoccus sp.]|uniref:GDSL-type esterase/lipase family protein n=1 Tax=uncultured Paracoccus sp. TaxID=189685 RepID=UPI0025E10D51|nr:GDSL-type esterase/lipase family protein [uncultured Paracoccus sp.]